MRVKLFHGFHGWTAGILAPIAVAMLAMAMPAAGWSAVAGQSIVADPPSINLGFLEPRSTVTRTFRLINTTAAPITIMSVTPTCTCTTVDAVGKVIAATSALEIPMTMKVSAATGMKTAAVTFVFSGSSPPVTLTMGGEIAYAVRATSIDATNNARVPYINAVVDPQRPSPTAPPPFGVITISSIDQKPFQILSVMNQPPAFVGFNPASDQPRSNYEVRYDFSNLACEQVPPYLVIATDHPQAPVIDIRVRHACTRISPQIPLGEYRANLGTVVGGTPQPFEFELKKSAGWKVLSTASKDPRLTIQLVGQTSDAEHAMVSLVAVVDAAVHGVVLAPVTMTATDPAGVTRASDFWVYFVVKESKTTPVHPASVPLASERPLQNPGS